jgi:hypothetical protein
VDKDQEQAQDAPTSINLLIEAARLAKVPIHNLVILLVLPILFPTWILLLFLLVLADSTSGRQKAGQTRWLCSTPVSS